MLKLQPGSLDWALHHVEEFGDTDIFPLPFEYAAIRHCWDSTIKPYLADQDMTKWATRPHRRCLSPKHRFGFRVSTQLDPLDTLSYLALVYEIGVDIENVRVPTSDNIVFSYRFKPDAAGSLFDLDYNYGTFEKHTDTALSSGANGFVVVADIADFYPRLYSHPLENALKHCTTKSGHVTSLTRMLHDWNYSISYGIPVGPAPSRLLAELAINDVDRALLSEGKRFCRYSDDYRIFCKDEREAYEALALLANTLFENHGLTLQQNKTEIMTAAEFRRRRLLPGWPGSARTLSDKFAEFLDRIGKQLYDPIDYDSLDASQKAEIDALDLPSVLNEQISKESIDITLTRTALNILSQVKKHDCVDLVTDNLSKLYTVLKSAAEYIQSFKKDTARQTTIGRKLLDSLTGTVVGHLYFHRCWILHTFTSDRQWDNEGRFPALYNELVDEFSRRELVLAMGRAGQDHWFKTRKREVHNMSPWEKRAFIAAASCLPGDEHKHWCDSIERQLDVLERSVASWSRQNKFR